MRPNCFFASSHKHTHTHTHTHMYTHGRHIVWRPTAAVYTLIPVFATETGRSGVRKRTATTWKTEALGRKPIRVTNTANLSRQKNARHNLPSNRRPHPWSSPDLDYDLQCSEETASEEVVPLALEVLFFVVIKGGYPRIASKNWFCIYARRWGMSWTKFWQLRVTFECRRQKLGTDCRYRRLAK